MQAGVTRLATLAALTALVAGGCGGGAAGGGSLDRTLRYFPKNSTGVIVFSTDLDSDQFKNLDRIVRTRTDHSIEYWLRKGVEDETKLSYDRDVKPLLGDELVIGSAGGLFDAVVVWHTADGDKLRRALDRDEDLRRGAEINGASVYEDVDDETLYAVDGDTLVSAAGGFLGSPEDTLRSALEQADRENGLTEDELRAKLEDIPEDALARGYVSAGEIVGFGNAEALHRIPWIRALRTVGAAVSFEEGHAILDLSFNTDAAQVRDADLPFASGDDPPGVFDREDALVGGNRNQSQTTVFLFRVAEAISPGSKFVRDTHALEREFKVDFADEILRAFDGPSASLVSLDGSRFAARSRVSDPERLRARIERVAPRLPRIIQALAPLRSEGQALLFLLAPDALTLGKRRGIEVTPPTGPEGLYHVTGLRGEGPSELWFGVLGDVFVVASDQETARAVAREETHEVEGAHGSTVLRVDLSGHQRGVAEQLGFDPGPLGELVFWVQSSRRRVRGHMDVEVK